MNNSKRSPSILVTDARAKGGRTNAPFAGHARNNIRNNNGTYQRVKDDSKYSKINLDNILLGSSTIPSARREQRGSISSLERFSLGSSRSSRYAIDGSNSGTNKNRINRNFKKSQKLVLIPEDNVLDTSNLATQVEQDNQRNSKIGQRRDNILGNNNLDDYMTQDKTSKRIHGTNRAAKYNKTILNNIPGVLDRKRHGDSDMINDSYREHEPVSRARLTAYNIAEGFNLNILGKFISETHEVSPRLYDDCLYVPYILPFLPGKDGFRIKSNVSKKITGKITLMDKLIDSSERRDHHFEFYSGVDDDATTNNGNNNIDNNDKRNSGEIFDDTNRDNNNLFTLNDSQSIHNNANDDTFDPSEPQLFSEETNRTFNHQNEVNLKNNKTSLQHIKSSELQNDNKIVYNDSSPIPNSIINDSIDLDDNANAQQYILQNEKKHAELFIFHYGVIVFWNFTEDEERNLLGDISFADIKTMVTKPLDENEIEIEEFQFQYDKDIKRPRIFNDIITLRSGDHFIKLTLSYAIAQSSKLTRLESRIDPILTSVNRLPRRLALYGTLGLRREQLLKKSAKLFSLRCDVNLSTNILDTPDFFWSIEPSLHPLYMAMREYLEIEKRVIVVNDRCKVFLEFFNICVDSVAEKNIVKVTRWFITVILLGVFFSLVEIFVRYRIIRQH